MIPIQLKEIEINSFEKSNICHICEEGESNVDDLKNPLFKVRDQCYLTGKFSSS